MWLAHSLSWISLRSVCFFMPFSVSNSHPQNSKCQNHLLNNGSKLPSALILLDLAINTEKFWQKSSKFFHVMLCFVFAFKQSQLILPRFDQIWLLNFMKIRSKRKFRLFWKTNFTNVLNSSGKNARSILDPLNEVKKGW